MAPGRVFFQPTQNYSRKSAVKSVTPAKFVVTIFGAAHSILLLHRIIASEQRLSHYVIPHTTLMSNDDSIRLLNPLLLVTNIRARALQTEVSPQQLARDGCAQFFPILQGVMVVKTSIDSSPEHLVDKVARILKRVGMDAVLKCSAIGHEMNFRGPEVAREQR